MLSTSLMRGALSSPAGRSGERSTGMLRERRALAGVIFFSAALVCGSPARESARRASRNAMVGGATSRRSCGRRCSAPPSCRTRVRGGRAVAIVIRPAAAGSQVLYILRAPRDSRSLEWTGGLPRSGCATRRTRQTTRARSARHAQEVGLRLDDARNFELLGQLPPRPSRAKGGALPGRCVVPFVFAQVAATTPPLALQPSEVAATSAGRTRARSRRRTCATRSRSRTRRCRARERVVPPALRPRARPRPRLLPSRSPRRLRRERGAARRRRRGRARCRRRASSCGA